MKEAGMSTYDLRIARVGDNPRGEWVIPSDTYRRVAQAATRGAVDIVIEGTVHSFSIESTTEGEEGYG